MLSHCFVIAQSQSLTQRVQVEQVQSFRLLTEAEEQLAVVEASRPGSSHSQQVAGEQQLLNAQLQVKAAAAAAEDASSKLHQVLAEKEQLAQDLAVMQRHLEVLPGHADLCDRLKVWPHL